MIESPEELAMARRQLIMLKDALAGMRHDIESASPKNFELLSQGYVRQIHELRSEIDAYLGIPPMMPSAAQLHPTEPQKV